MFSQKKFREEEYIDNNFQVNCRINKVLCLSIFSLKILQVLVFPRFDHWNSCNFSSSVWYDLVRLESTFQIYMLKVGNAIYVCHKN